MARQTFFTRSQIVAIPIPWKIWKGIGERSRWTTKSGHWPNTKQAAVNGNKYNPES